MCPRGEKGTRVTVSLQPQAGLLRGPGPEPSFWLLVPPQLPKNTWLPASWPQTPQQLSAASPTHPPTPSPGQASLTQPRGAPRGQVCLWWSSHSALVQTALTRVKGSCVGLVCPLNPARLPTLSLSPDLPWPAAPHPHSRPALYFLHLLLQTLTVSSWESIAGQNTESVSRTSVSSALSAPGLHASSLGPCPSTQASLGGNSRRAPPCLIHHPIPTLHMRLRSD